MKTKFALLSFLLLPLAACSNNANSKNSNDEQTPPINNKKSKDYGAFLGRSDNNDSNFEDYEYVSFEFDEFSKSKIEALNKSGTKTFAYLNIGSVETYRSYYDQFKSITFADYENWEDERWVKVSDSSWQDFVINTLAKHFKELGAYGVYMDNVDVYTIWGEQGHSKDDFTQGIKNIINGVNNLGLKVMVNGGSEFLDDMLDCNDIVIDSIFAYHQEEVFSLIENYDNDTFGKQEKEDKEYYQYIASSMKSKGKEVFFLEYTKDNSLISSIDSYCKTNGYHYYISKTVGLT